VQDPPKCARCSGAIEDRQLVYFEHGDLIHVRCWRVEVSQERIRESRRLIQRTRELLDDPPAPPPDGQDDRRAGAP
jgi:hypothetical protein